MKAVRCVSSRFVLLIVQAMPSINKFLLGLMLLVSTTAAIASTDRHEKVSLATKRMFIAVIAFGEEQRPSSEAPLKFDFKFSDPVLSSISFEEELIGYLEQKLQQGGKLDQPWQDAYLLHYATRYDLVEVVKWLLDHGADPWTHLPNDPRDAIGVAVTFHSWHVHQLLLERVRGHSVEYDRAMLSNWVGGIQNGRTFNEIWNETKQLPAGDELKCLIANFVRWGNWGAAQKVVAKLGGFEPIGLNQIRRSQNAPLICQAFDRSRPPMQIEDVDFDDLQTIINIQRLIEAPLIVQFLQMAQSDAQIEQLMRAGLPTPWTDAQFRSQFIDAALGKNAAIGSKLLSMMPAQYGLSSLSDEQYAKTYAWIAPRTEEKIKAFVLMIPDERLPTQLGAFHSQLSLEVKDTNRSAWPSKQQSIRLWLDEMERRNLRWPGTHKSQLVALNDFEPSDWQRSFRLGFDIDQCETYALRSVPADVPQCLLALLNQINVQQIPALLNAVFLTKPCLRDSVLDAYLQFTVEKLKTSIDQASNYGRRYCSIHLINVAKFEAIQHATLSMSQRDRVLPFECAQELNQEQIQRLAKLKVSIEPDIDADRAADFEPVTGRCTLLAQKQLRQLIRKYVDGGRDRSTTFRKPRSGWTDAQLLDIDGDGNCEIVITGGDPFSVRGPFEEGTAFEPYSMSACQDSDADSLLLFWTGQQWEERESNGVLLPNLGMVRNRKTGLRYVVVPNIEGASCSTAMPPKIMVWNHLTPAEIEDCQLPTSTITPTDAEHEQMADDSQRDYSRCVVQQKPPRLMPADKTAIRWLQSINRDEHHRESFNVGFSDEARRLIYGMESATARFDQMGQPSDWKVFESLYSGNQDRYVKAIQANDIATLKRIHARGVLPATVAAGLTLLSKKRVEIGTSQTFVELLKAHSTEYATADLAELFNELLSQLFIHRLSLAEADALRQVNHPSLTQLFDQWANKQNDLSQACNALDQLKLAVETELCDD